MAKIIDYATLVSAIQEVSENDGAEFLAYIPTAIALAEELMFKELDLEDLEIKVSGSLIQGSSFLAKPAGYEYANFLTVTVNSNKQFLKKRQEDFIIDYWPNSSILDTPKYYGDASETQFIIAPAPDITYPYEIKYVAKPEGVSASSTTNYYVTSCSDTLFYASMIQMSIFIKAPEQIKVWSSAYTTSRDSWNMSDKRTRRDNGSIPFNTDNGTNIVTQTAQSNA